MQLYSAGQLVADERVGRLISGRPGPQLIVGRAGSGQVERGQSAPNAVPSCGRGAR